MEALPSLSIDGFVVNKQILMLKLYEHFTVADYIQSNTFAGGVASLKYILNESRDEVGMREMVDAQLTKLYLAYYDTVNIDVTVVPSDNKTSISVNITATDTQGTVYTLSKMINTVDNKIVSIGTDEVKYHE